VLGVSEEPTASDMLINTSYIIWHTNPDQHLNLHHHEYLVLLLCMTFIFSTSQDMT